MANTKSAAKNARKAARRHIQGVAVRSQLKTLRKKALLAAENKLPAEEISAATRENCSKYAKAASNNYIHPKTAARKISRLMKAINKLQN